MHFYAGFVFRKLARPLQVFTLALPAFKDVLQRLPHAVSDFHPCMFGSQRRKHTKLLLRVPRFSRLPLPCTQDREPLRPGRLPDGSFACGAEFRRPPLLCNHVAQSVSEQLVELAALPLPSNFRRNFSGPPCLLVQLFIPGPVECPPASAFRIRSGCASLPSGSKLAAAFVLPSQVPAFPQVPYSLLAPSAFGLFRSGLTWALLHLLRFFQLVRQYLLSNC